MASIEDHTGLEQHLEKPGAEKPWFLRSSYAVSLPHHDALTQSQPDFESFLASSLCRSHDEEELGIQEDAVDASTKSTETFTVVDVSSTGGLDNDLTSMSLDPPAEVVAEAVQEAEGNATAGPFIKGLLNHANPNQGSLEPPPDMENRMLTENGDLTFRSTENPLVDLFVELEDVLSPVRMRDLLQAAWAHDPISTLKIIFNCRSIHLGKSTRRPFYRAAGWLAQNHPLTLLANLRWLGRPVIEKKMLQTREQGGEEDLVMVEAVKEDDDPTRFDVRNGVAHGYWKDLLNILALAANGKLDGLEDPREVLNVQDGRIKRAMMAARERKRNGTPYQRPSKRRLKRKDAVEETEEQEEKTEEKEEKSEEKDEKMEGKEEMEHQDGEKTELQQVEAAPEVEDAAEEEDKAPQHNPVALFESDALYRALHLTVARLFAEQLKSDLAALRGSDAKVKRNISLCGKWAPSHKRFHDRHTLIVTSIAEILYPREPLAWKKNLSATDDRETYLRFAREEYRKDISALRKHLGVVERNISVNDFAGIKYDRLPSHAMKTYTKLFIQKDLDRFEEYIEGVAAGKARISGATLLPSAHVHRARHNMREGLSHYQDLKPKDIIELKVRDIEAKSVDGQWKTLVQRIRDSGTLSSSIAVCDVSSSMTSPQFADGTCPMDSAIGLSLLMAEVTQPPFGGAFISFTTRPLMIQVNPKDTFGEQVEKMIRSPWGGSTDLVAVFEKLILPMAVANKLPQEDMVKRIFVFSDMHFNSATGDYGYYDRPPRVSEWSSSFDRIKKAYGDAGYQMPELVFWDLAGGRAGGYGDSTTPKPVTAAEPGVSMVSGYSQAMLKIFLQSGGFDEEDKEEEEEDDDDDDKEDGNKADGNAKVKSEKGEKSKTKTKTDPLWTVKKAISHKAYDMLVVVD